ncbi:hypothetical protein KVR01_002206 [Diaporthe batatas]|uniref:uncharacterized protein n=1 Tax=Diaporthe batatas TaxID=748121 RepID=UPI001D04E61B|nr:uncharacterized protein KVR01_002206 [Diaporthe batatas]KAG8166517.1 hypothetical protein KVR01_002206 [Diaporthe batatas]
MALGDQCFSIPSFPSHLPPPFPPPPHRLSNLSGEVIYRPTPSSAMCGQAFFRLSPGAGNTSAAGSTRLRSFVEIPSARSRRSVMPAGRWALGGQLPRKFRSENSRYPLSSSLVVSPHCTGGGGQEKDISDPINGIKLEVQLPLPTHTPPPLANSPCLPALQSCLPLRLLRRSRGQASVPHARAVLHTRPCHLGLICVARPGRAGWLAGWLGCTHTRAYERT